ncbi:MAG: iron-containing alcohol dehydrogenase [Eubacteriales bacterium]
MRNFVYCVPTEVVFGENATDKTADLVQSHGGSRVFVVYGGGSAVKSGLLEKITADLETKDIIFEIFGGVQPNPTLSHARLGVEKAIAMGADFILAVGGGSVIDTAKAIAHGVANPQVDIWDFWLAKQPVTATTPVGTVLTIPAAGSETSDSAVLTDTSIGFKKGLSTQFNRPVFAVMEPKLALSLPKYQVACGITDIMMHTLDRYFNPISDNELTDQFAEALLRVLVAKGKKFMDDPTDVHAMSEIMWAGSVSHNGLTGLGGNKDFAPHQFSQAIGGKFDKAHGACLASIWSSWARYVYPVNPMRFHQYAENVWNMADGLAAIDATERFFLSLGMPVNLPQLVGKQDEAGIEDLALRCSFQKTRTIGTFKVLDFEDMKAVFSAANND